MAAADFDNMFADLGSGFGQTDLAPNASFDELFNGPTQFTSINNPSNPATSVRTVSPKDLHADISAPPSAALTNLTSPDIDASPFMSGSFDTSPMFTGLDVNGSDWYPLFPQESADTGNTSFTQPLERNPSTQSLAQTSSPSSKGSPVVLDSSNRRKSSTSSPALNAGIGKTRRRKAPLPPILVDSNDKVAMKRARNTLAARDSRQRKVEHVAQLTARIAELEEDLAKKAQETEYWKALAGGASISENGSQQS